MEGQKGKVGPFFYIRGKVYSDAVDFDQAENYGDFKTWGSHWQFWDKLARKNYEFADMEYNYFPRGRVTYNFVKDIYYLYLNPKLNKEKIVVLIAAEFNLIGLNYVIDTKDEHYKS